MNLLYIITVLLLFAYCWMISRLGAGWKNLHGYVRAPNPGEKKKFVSVVIPVRNEERILSGIGRDLAFQDYPGHAYEIIFIDDHSADGSLRILEGFGGKLNNLRVLKADQDRGGKKAALDKGIRHAKGEIILTTDADCRVGPRWISTMAGYFSANPRCQLLSGPVIIRPGKGFMGYFEQLEYSALVGSGAGAIGLHRPLMCSSSNLAYYRESYIRHARDIHAETPSGDDVFLMLGLSRKDARAIFFIKDRAAMVETEGAGSIGDFFMQRLRWTSKSRYYRDLNPVFVALLVFTVNAWLCMLFWGLLIDFYTFLVSFLFAVNIKTICDYLFFRQIKGFLNISAGFFKLIPMEFICFLYIPLIGLSGSIVPVKWKGRKLKT